MFSRQHYKGVAKVIQSHNRKDDTLPVQTRVWQIAFDLSDLFARDNPRFDFLKFMGECGYPEGDMPQ